MRFHLEDAGGRDLLLRIHARGYTANNTIPHQNVEVVVNGRTLAIWRVGEPGWHESVIQAELLGDGLVKLLFVNKEPKSRCDVGAAISCRRLGINVSELEIVPAPAKARRP